MISNTKINEFSIKVIREGSTTFKGADSFFFFLFLFFTAERLPGDRRVGFDCCQ